MTRRTLGRIAIPVGLLVTLGFVFLLRHRSWLEQLGLALLYFATQLVLYGVWRWGTYRTNCPQCSSLRATLSYNANRDEYLTCDDCGLHQATGMSQPND